MYKAIALVVFVFGLALVEPHGYVRIPISRTAIFRDPQFASQAQPPFNWNYAGQMCGDVPQNLNYTTCGRCGDAPGETHNNQGGRYDKGIITGTFTAGQRIRVTVQMTATHRGFWQLELCPQATETNTCFQRLNILAGSAALRDGTICVLTNNDAPLMWAEVQLPANVRCTRCTLRWTYRTSYPPNPDACFNGGPAQTFRQCVDIRIN